MSAGNTIESNLAEYYGSAEVRWYQVASRNRLVWALENGFKRPLIVQPTGCGKTITIAFSMDCPNVRRALKCGSEEILNVVFMSHNHRLLTQAERTFAESSHLNLMLVSSFAEADAKLFKDAHVIIMDEAHHEAMMSNQYHLEFIECPIIGMTATNDRPDGALLKFDYIIEPISREDAVREGFLAETDLYTFCTSAGRDKSTVACDILDMYHQIMGGTLVFMRTKAEARKVAEHITNLGYKVACLTDTTTKQTNDALDKFSNGEYDFIVNCAKLGEGIDVKGCESVLIGLNLGSIIKLNQIIGRAARPDCDCRVFELVDPLSRDNLDTTCVVGTPRQHKLAFYEGGEWVVEDIEVA